jgi:predicted nucleotide-binding protein
LTDTPNEPTPLMIILHNLLQRSAEILSKSSVNRFQLNAWTSGVRSQLSKIYGKDVSQLPHFSSLTTSLPDYKVREELIKRVEHLRRIVNVLDALPSTTQTPLLGRRIFIGHGRSQLWRVLKDFIADRLQLPWDEFNREATAGYPTTDRLESMMSQAAFAFLVMTAEEEHVDETLHARPNVIHEVGLFQGHLGLSRAIVMLEDGCSEFSNIIGLSQIRFPRGDISARFEEVRRVLERERLI